VNKLLRNWIRTARYFLLSLQLLSAVSAALVSGIDPVSAESSRREARQTTERLQEQIQQQQEQQREQQKREQERQREAAKTQQNKGNNSDKSDRNDKADRGDKDDSTNATLPKSESDKSKSAEKSKEKSAKTDDKDASSEALPATVAEWFERLKAAKTPETKDPSPARPVRSDEVKPTIAPSQKGAVASRPARGGAIADLPALPFARTEFLAVNLPARALDSIKRAGFKPNGIVPLPRLNLALTRLLIPEGYTLEQARNFLQNAIPNVDFELNKKYRIYKVANAPAANRNIDAPRAPRPMGTPCGTDRCFGGTAINWQPSHGDCAAKIRIGVLDTGYDDSHQALGSQRSRIKRQRVSKGAPAPHWHGTGVLAILAGDSASTTPGLIPQAEFFVSDVFYLDSDGQPTSDTASLVEGLEWLDKNGAQIINMSLVGPADALLEMAIERLAAKGMIFVAAAGNNGPHAPPSYPAGYAPVIAVTAVSSSFQNYRHASRGDHIDFAAPGVDIWTAIPGNIGAYHSGTSFATPYVTAVIASMYRALPAKTKEGILSRTAVRDLGDPGRDQIFGQGLIIAPRQCNGASGLAQASPTDDGPTSKKIAPNLTTFSASTQERWAPTQIGSGR
jgi:subtilisin family serine protease